jgi:DNA polymerase III delta prime subunit
MGTMRLGDLLVRAKRVTEQDVEAAVKRSQELGGRLGENLVAIGAIDQKTLSNFVNRIPTEPVDLAATGMDEADLIDLLLKLIYTQRLQTVRHYLEAIKLPYHIVADVVKTGVDRALLQTLGSRRSDNLLDMAYSLTDAGRMWAKNALERSGYAGPAPITLEEFAEQTNVQKPTNEVITVERILTALEGLDMDQAIVEQVGPALNSGRAILMYGPPGNGKTTVALRFASAFHDVVYVPYAVGVEGQTIRVFDPAIHQEVSPAEVGEEPSSFMRDDETDKRWVACRRPFVIVGGELTLEMLDLRYDETGRFYEAPLHMKALGGVFFIDDFGRQLVSPTHLLNRWIVPLENRYDFLKLHTGKSLRIPFEELVIFSTNLDPEDLMDPAFLRRLPYKIEVGGPDAGRFRRILQTECERNGMKLTEDIFAYIVNKLRREKMMDLAAYQPRFIVDQVVATCRFLEQPPHFEARYIDYALDNLRVKRPNETAMGQRTAAQVV